MARPDHLYVFAYDIERDSIRNKVADKLGESLVRVQKSVFEGRMSAPDAARLSQRIALMIGPSDSLRVYAVTEAGRRASHVHGAGVMAEASEFWLL
jgi:CRISPR-associated protein Cas2